MTKKIESTLLEQLTTLRHELHTHPELSGEEQATAKRIAEELRRLSPDRLVAGIGGHGLIAEFNGKAEGPRLMFRAELDALPIQETNDRLSYSSRVRNKSHKCGHDGHMTIIMGLARLIAANRPESGSVIFLFQPAEETGEGATWMLEDDKFAAFHPDYAFALHNLPGFPLGAIVTKAGAFNASVKSLILRLQGKTSHAAEPENGINPAPAIAKILEMAETRSLPDAAAEDFRLATPVHVIMGEPAYGVSAGYGEVHLTLRCWRKALMDEWGDAFLRESQEIAQSYGLSTAFEWTNVFRANFNDAPSVKLIREVAAAENLPFIIREQPFKWGEDFGAFSQRFSGAMFGLGAGKNMPALHNPDYDFPDALIETGILICSGICDRLLNEKKGR